MAEMFARLKKGDFASKRAVTPATPVTDVTGYRSKPLELQALQPLQVKNSKLGKRDVPAVTRPVPVPPESDEAEILERVGLCAGSVPAVYLDAWARLNCQKPMRVSEAEWRQALDDGGRFLDQWGSLAAEWCWTACELFDVPRGGEPGGVIWRLCGALVEAYGPEYVRLSDGRIIERGTIGGAYGA